MGMITVRMGDGYLEEMTSEEVVSDIQAGTEDAASKGRIPPLTEDEMARLYEICTMPAKFVCVERGREVVLTYDGGTNKIMRLGIPSGRVSSLQIYERLMGADTGELSHLDYSYKPVKPIVHEEQHDMEDALHCTVLPLFYGAMPNLGLYTQPDGPVPNPAELLPQGRIAEARQCTEETIELAIKDMVYVASRMYEAGADGVNFDTTGAAGDGDFLATLKAVETLKKTYPDLCIEVGMAGETVLGMHGELFYEGVRLAGLRPHEQVKLVEKAGGTIFGPAINTNTSKSLAWNLSRAVTYTKACVAAATIPVHANVGMGVGGIPMHEVPCPDAVSRVSVALAEIGGMDGL